MTVEHVVHSEKKSVSQELAFVSSMFSRSIEDMSPYDAQIGLEKLEALIHDIDKEGEIVLVVGNESIPVYSAGRETIDREAKRDLQPGDVEHLKITHDKLNIHHIGQTDITRSVFIGSSYMTMIDFVDLAKAVARGAELRFMPNIEQRLREQWDQMVTSRVGEDKKGLAKSFLNEIIASYSEDGREYHNLDHIWDCLELLEPYRDRDDFNELWFAVATHDVIYDTHATDNEEQSGVLASDMLDQLGLPGGETVKRLVGSTKSHATENEDESLICSVDLAILASDEKTYREYCLAIRGEYSWVPEAIYKTERARILRSLKDPFSHPDFVHLNEIATKNIEQEIEQLEK